MKYQYVTYCCYCDLIKIQLINDHVDDKVRVEDDDHEEGEMMIMNHLGLHNKGKLAKFTTLDVAALYPTLQALLMVTKMTIILANLISPPTKLQILDKVSPGEQT